MKKNISILITVLGVAIGTGCSVPKQASLRDDPRAGSDASPYRTIAPSIQCDDCRMPSER